jgi:hypothetical protein
VWNTPQTRADALQGSKARVIHAQDALQQSRRVIDTRQTRADALQESKARDDTRQPPEVVFNLWRVLKLGQSTRLQFFFCFMQFFAMFSSTILFPTQYPIYVH